MLVGKAVGMDVGRFVGNAMENTVDTAVGNNRNAGSRTVVGNDVGSGVGVSVGNAAGRDVGNDIDSGVSRDFGCGVGRDWPGNCTEGTRRQAESHEVHEARRICPRESLPAATARRRMGTKSQCEPGLRCAKS